MASDRKALIPEAHSEFEDKFQLSLGFQSGDFVYGAMVGIQEKEGEAGMREAFHMAFQGAQAVLAEANLTWSDVIDMTTFHTDIQAQREIFLDVKSNYVKSKPYPAWAAIGIKDLWLPNIIVEIKLVAQISSQ